MFNAHCTFFSKAIDHIECSSLSDNILLVKDHTCLALTVIPHLANQEYT